MLALCQSSPAAGETYSVDTGRRNRIEQRTARLWPLPAGTGTEPWHDRFKAVVEVRRKVECFNAALHRFEERQERPACYLATCDAPVETLARAIREHWGVENRLHDALDVTLGEDASRIRKAPGIFAQLRHFGLNLLRYNGVTNISMALYDNAINLERVLNYKGIKH